MVKCTAFAQSACSRFTSGYPHTSTICQTPSTSLLTSERALNFFARGPSSLSITGKRSRAKWTMCGWTNHTMNINKAVMKDSEGKLFSEIAEADVAILQGIGEKSKEVMDKLKLKTVKELASYKYFKMARAIVSLAATEEKDARGAASVMNLDQAVDVEYETKTLAEVVLAPVSALQGLSESAAELLADLNVKTVSDLANFKYCLWAESICTLAEYEHKKSFAERKQERLAKADAM